MRPVIAAFVGSEQIAVLGRAEEDATVFLVEATSADSGEHLMWCVDMTSALDAVQEDTTIRKPFGDVAAETVRRNYNRAMLLDTVATEAVGEVVNEHTLLNGASLSPPPPPPPPERSPPAPVESDD